MVNNAVIKAFAPANISCIFKIYENSDPAKSGSTGLGFTLDKGVTIEVSFSESTEIFFNRKKINFPTVRSVIRKIVSVNEYKKEPRFKINIFSSFPLGAGFGLSGGSALAVSYALNKLLRLKKSNLELAKIAHIAEVENKTGLGDVTNQYFGGFLLKTVSSAEFNVQRLPIENVSVYYKYFSKLSTGLILSDIPLRRKINRAATESLQKVRDILKTNENKFNKNLFADLIHISKEFAKQSGLLQNQQVLETIQKIESKGGHSSMIMLGNAIFSDIPFEDAERMEISTNRAYNS